MASSKPARARDPSSELAKKEEANEEGSSYNI